jgi:hypothetical protein
MAKLQTARSTRAGLSQRDNRYQQLRDAWDQTGWGRSGLNAGDSQADFAFRPSRWHGWQGLCWLRLS